MKKKGWTKPHCRRMGEQNKWREKGKQAELLLEWGFAHTLIEMTSCLSAGWTGWPQMSLSASWAADTTSVHTRKHLICFLLTPSHTMLPVGRSNSCTDWYFRKVLGVICAPDPLDWGISVQGCQRECCLTAVTVSPKGTFCSAGRPGGHSITEPQNRGITVIELQLAEASGSSGCLWSHPAPPGPPRAESPAPHPGSSWTSPRRRACSLWVLVPECITSTALWCCLVFRGTSCLCPLPLSRHWAPLTGAWFCPLSTLPSGTTLPQPTLRPNPTSHLMDHCKDRLRRFWHMLTETLWWRQNPFPSLSEPSGHVLRKQERHTVGSAQPGASAFFLAEWAQLGLAPKRRASKSSGQQFPQDSPGARAGASGREANANAAFSSS